MGKFNLHPSARLTPENLLRSVLNDVEDVDGIIMLIRDKEDSYSSCWSNITTGNMCYALTVFQKRVHEELEEDTR